jgi:hypothetical protein
MATTIKALTLNAQNTVRARVTSIRIGPTEFDGSLLNRPCIGSISDGRNVRTRTLRLGGVRQI